MPHTFSNPNKAGSKPALIKLRIGGATPHFSPFSVFWKYNSDAEGDARSLNSEPVLFELQKVCARIGLMPHIFCNPNKAGSRPALIELRIGGATRHFSSFSVLWKYNSDAEGGARSLDSEAVLFELQKNTRQQPGLA